MENIVYSTLKKYKDCLCIKQKFYPNEIYYSIEGNIGNGKSSLLNLIEKELQERDDFIDENVDTIEEKVNVNWLNAFIRNPDDLTFTFQIKRLMETINNVRIMGTKKEFYNNYGEIFHCIGDRLPFGNLSFAITHLMDGLMSPEEFELYSQTLCDGGPYIYPNVLFLNCDPKISLKRINLRNRGKETEYTLEYLEKLDWINHIIFLYLWAHNIVEVIPVDWSFDFNDDVSSNQKRFQKIITLLRTWKWKNVSNPIIELYKYYIIESTKPNNENSLQFLTYTEIKQIMKYIQEYVWSSIE